MIAGLLVGLWLGFGVFNAVEMGPHIRVRRDSPDMLGLPSNATSIRETIATSFSCDLRAYGYYADPDNDCQIFHVCLPVHFDDGTDQVFKWSFICPQETVFNQETFTCAREEDAVACEDSPLFYSLNDRFGQTDSDLPPSSPGLTELPPASPDTY